MNSHELLTLPVGTRLRWEEAQVDDEVIARDPLTIRISNGNQTTVAPDDDDLSEFAGSLELAEPLADTPVVAGQRHHAIARYRSPAHRHLRG